MGFFYIVEQQTYAVIERFGKYHATTAPGLHFKIPIVDQIVGRVSIRVQELNVTVRTKTNDNVFTDLLIAVQYFVDAKDIWNAFYRLSHPETQMESYIYDVVRAKVPHMKLDEVFEKKEDIAEDIQEKLSESMGEYGFTIKVSLVNDIRPEQKVADAMNEINAQQRYQVAAEYKGEAEKILIVKAAEADAESKRLSGKGIADQRKEIASGWADAVGSFEKATGVNTTEVMNLMLMTQHYDTLADLGKVGQNKVIFTPYTPNTVGDFRKQIMEAMEAK